MTQATSSPTLASVQDIIAELTGYDPQDIQPHYHLEDDLQLDLERDFPLVIKRINRHFNTNLSSKELINEVETIADLVEYIEDETELG
jgi:acyl carrier protein